jgi:hypothetical protein
MSYFCIWIIFVHFEEEHERWNQSDGNDRVSVAIPGLHIWGWNGVVPDKVQWNSDNLGDVVLQTIFWRSF